MASQETRSDANKALYYNIYTEIMEKEMKMGAEGLDEDQKAIMNEAKGILDKTDAIN